VKRVVVIGAGAAGTAAALAAAREGAETTLLDGGSGASTLATGAFDFYPWDGAAGNADGAEDGTAGARALSLFDVLGHARAGAPRGMAGAMGLQAESAVGTAWVATTAGVVRPAFALDRALLDLGPLLASPSRGAGTVLVPRAEHTGWSADTLARAWSDDARARGLALTFVAVDGPIARLSDERTIADAEIAARHDDPARLAWLASCLQDARRKAGLPAATAIVLPPWLGVDQERAGELSLAVGVAVGEALAMPGGPSGLRFERARDRALREAGVTTLRGRAMRVESAAGEGEGDVPGNSAWDLSIEVAEGAERRRARLAAEAVVVCAGGVLGGGIRYTPSAALLAGELPPHATRSFVATIEGPLPLGAFAQPLVTPGSLFGVPPESMAWPFAAGGHALFDHVGVLTDADGRVKGTARGIFAAGDFVADGPRTWLGAFASGARAGRAAAGAARA
jgi:glycerol-3-phosphate dehydrogenase subunit B